MADLATPSAATMGTINAGATPDTTTKQAITKPEKPDEASFKAELEKLRKALGDAQESTVRLLIFLFRDISRNLSASQQRDSVHSF